MLKLSNIRKSYAMGDNTVEALKGIDIEFRENEFVSILGPSGCGKTTTLNIIGGLDRYTSGDLMINGKSTKEYSDKDWDTYRNHSIGFVFQSYNLIPHQTVLANVELALTLSGVSKAERHQRAKDALQKVGLGDQLNKKPSQMSGGQMQRVAIARALINDPDILLADEPTGALDSETSVQVMELLKEVAQDRLVIMVTHNPELAEAYSTRIIRLKDGLIIGDSNPYHEEEESPSPVQKQREKAKKKSMSFLTALSLSLNNLMTKKGRTILTSFAGSIGIIGIALILALSTGINRYIDQVQQDTLSSYPIVIEAESVDMSTMMNVMMGVHEDIAAEDMEPDRVYSSTVMFDMMNSMLNAEASTNNLKDFKAYLDNGGGIRDLAKVNYSYDFNFPIYTEDADGKIIKSDIMVLMADAMATMYGGDYSSYFESSLGSMYESMDVWQELLPGEGDVLVGKQVTDQYDLIYGTWPQNYDEVVLFVNENNRISDMMLYALGLISTREMDEYLLAMKNGDDIESHVLNWGYEELCDTTFKLILPSEFYQKDPSADAYIDMSLTETGMDFLYRSDDIGTTIKVVGIARPSEEASSAMVTGAIGYTQALSHYAIRNTHGMDIVMEQLENRDTDVLTGLPFPTGNEIEPTDQEKADAITEHLQTLSAPNKAAAYVEVMSCPDDQYVADAIEKQMDGLNREDIEEFIVQQYAAEIGVPADTVMGYIAQMTDEELFSQVRSAFDTEIRQQYAVGVKQKLGVMSSDQLAAAMDTLLSGDAAAIQYAGLSPLSSDQYQYLYEHFMPPTVSGSTYAENLELLGYVDLESPSRVSIYADTFKDKDAISDRIEEYNLGVEEEDKITYTDYVALLMSSVTAIISGISYLLIAFVSISLIVSSIMIGVITLISVQERTKEIGILRAVGASKKDVSRVFNAETLIVGMGAGLVGIGVTVLATIPINAILLHYTGLVGLKASLPVSGGAILVCISSLLTILAGLIPSKIAARKDPVEALRNE